MKFSIIIPVYNREDYLDRSIGSVLQQSFESWELILVDDGSTDNSYLKCEEYTKKDKRIQLLSQENSGPGSARNHGIRYARGEYLLFLDSDDWYEDNCLMELSRSIDLNEPDIVLFFTKELKADGREKINKRIICTERILNEKTSRKLMCRDIFVGSRTVKRQLVLDNHIYFPQWPTHEDELYGLLCHACAEKVIQIPYCFYNYDQTTPISASKYTCDDKWDLIFASYRTAIKEFEIRGLLGTFGISLAKTFLVDSRASLFPNGGKGDSAIYDKIEPVIHNLIYPLSRKIAFMMRRKYIVFGSYTLRSAVNTLVLNPQKYVKHFQFSSLEASLQETKYKTEFTHENPFRASMVKKEFEREFLKELKELDFDFLVIDFLEERFNLWKIENVIITGSDALNSGELYKKEKMKHEINRNSKEAEILFQESVRKLKDLLEECCATGKVVLVENYLSEGYGEFEEEEKFNEIDSIRAMNEILRKYYRIFGEIFPDVVHVKPKEKNKTFFSDKGYKHGCYPWHSVESWECDVADEIYEAIGEI